MIRISRRGKIGLSALAAVIVAGALAAVVVVPLGALSHAAHAAPRAVSVTYTGHRGTVKPTKTGTALPKGIIANKAAIACVNDTNLGKQANCGLLGGDTTAKIGARKPTLHRPAAHSKFNGGTGVASASQAPRTSALNIATTTTGAVTNNFNGVSNDDNATVNGFVLTPPDQGLCVGLASALEGTFPLGVPGTNTVVVEPVNEAVRIFNPSGHNLTGVFSLATLFNDIDADGDVSCLWDPGTKTFFFTEIGVLQDPSSPDFGQVVTDVAVINASGYAAYQVDTSVGGTCFPDFPHQGFDTHALYITVNQFDCGPASDGFYAGAMVWALSKSQLASRASSVNFVFFGPLLLGGTQTLAIAPAFGNASGNEYMVNSFPYDEFGNDNNTAKTLGFWTVTNDSSITTGSGLPTLTGTLINSETYAFPQPAASTGTGLTDSSGITSEAFLNPDDSRMEQLQLLNTSQGLRLFSALDTAVNISGDPTARDGAAWFMFNPSTKSVVSPGLHLSRQDLHHVSVDLGCEQWHGGRRLQHDQQDPECQHGVRVRADDPVRWPPLQRGQDYCTRLWSSHQLL